MVGVLQVCALRLDRHQMISSTDAARRFSEYLDRTRTLSDRLFITRNNEIQAVLLSIEDFERLAELEELVEHLELAQLVVERQDEPETTLDQLIAQEGLTVDELR